MLHTDSMLAVPAGGDANEVEDENEDEEDSFGIGANDGGFYPARTGLAT